MATYAIGDLQGCYDPLQRLLEKLRFDPARDRLWFCGDLVNRGGQSLEVLRLVRSLDALSHVVLGNHDLALLSIAERSPDDQRRVNTDLRRVLEASDARELLDWLRLRPLLHADERLGFALIHAGLAPKWTLKTAARRAREVEHKRRVRDRHGLCLGRAADRARARTRAARHPGEGQSASAAAQGVLARAVVFTSWRVFFASTRRLRQRAGRSRGRRAIVFPARRAFRL